MKPQARMILWAMVAAILVVIVAACVWYIRLPHVDFRRRTVSPSTETYPRLANYYLSDRTNDSEVDSLARYQLLVLGLENQANNPDVLRRIRQVNPTGKMIAYVALNEYYTGVTDKEPVDGPWHHFVDRLELNDYLYDPNGSIVQFWPGCMSLNLTRRATCQKIVDFIVTQYDWSIWDGVFFDNCWSDVGWYNRESGGTDMNRDGVMDEPWEFNLAWGEGRNWILAETRRRLGPDRLLIANQGGDNVGQGVLNGRMIEELHNNVRINDYLDFCWDGYQPSASIIHEGGLPDELPKMRFAYCLALMGNGYFAADFGKQWHHGNFWFDDLYRSLGAATSAPIKIDDQRWVRSFEGGFVFWSESFQPTTVRVTEVSGRPRLVTVPARDGLIIRTKR